MIFHDIDWLGFTYFSLFFFSNFVTFVFSFPSDFEQDLGNCVHRKVIHFLTLSFKKVDSQKKRKKLIRKLKWGCDWFFQHIFHTPNFDVDFFQRKREKNGNLSHKDRYLFNYLLLTYWFYRFGWFLQLSCIFFL